MPRISQLVPNLLREINKRLVGENTNKGKREKNMTRISRINKLLFIVGVVSNNSNHINKHIGNNNNMNNNLASSCLCGE